MGVWGTAISSNDDYQDCYSEILDLYNKGTSINETLEIIRDKYMQEFSDDFSAINSLQFALAYAAWECGSTDNSYFKNAKEIIDSGKDTEMWRELGATDSDLKKRKKAADIFLGKLSVAKDKPRKAKEIKFKTALFRKGDILSIALLDGNFSGAVVLENISVSEEYAANFIVKAFIKSTEKMTIDEILKAKIYDYSWYLGVHYKKYIKSIEVIGNTEIMNDYSECRGMGSTSSGWVNFVEINENHYIVAENSDIKDIQTFMKYTPKQIAERQRQHVLSNLKKIKNR